MHRTTIVKKTIHSFLPNIMAAPPDSDHIMGLEVEKTITIGEDRQAVNFYQQVSEKRGEHFFYMSLGRMPFKKL